MSNPAYMLGLAAISRKPTFEWLQITFRKTTQKTARRLEIVDDDPQSVSFLR